VVLLQRTRTTLDLVAEGEGLEGEVEGGTGTGTRTANIWGNGFTLGLTMQLKIKFQRFRAAEFQVLSLIKPSFDLDWNA
jgi:hypothetical protein